MKPFPSRKVATISENRHPICVYFMRIATPALILILVLCTSAAMIAEEEKEKIETPDFSELELKDGSVLIECFVKRVSTEGLVIRHSTGMAEVSFFDLDQATQEKYGFDPVAALAAYKKRVDWERTLRKERVHEAARRQAAEEHKQAEVERYEVAKENWVPCEARVVSSAEAGIYVIARQIILSPTQIRSTLGFVRPGPPKRKLKRFGLGMIFLKNIEPIPVAGSTWQGYINPVTVEVAPDPDTGEETIPVHSAISNKP